MLVAANDAETLTTNDKVDSLVIGTIIAIHLIGASGQEDRFMKLATLLAKLSRFLKKKTFPILKGGAEVGSAFFPIVMHFL